MLAYTYLQKGKFGLREKPKPKITDARDAIVRVTLGSICMEKRSENSRL